LLGTIYTVQGRNSEAILALKRAVRLSPDDFDAWNSLGVNHKAVGDRQEAVADFRAAIRANSLCAEAYSNLGMALQDLGQSDDAVSCCSEAIKIRPDYAEAYNNLAIALLSMGRVDEALLNVARAVELRPNYSDALANFALALQKSGRSVESVNKYNELEKIIDFNFEQYKNFGDALFSAQQFEKSIEIYNISISANPTDDTIYYRLGIVYQAIRNYEMAVKSTLKATELNPNSYDAFNSLGNIYRVVGRPFDAVRAYSQAIELNSNFLEPHSSMVFTMQYCKNYNHVEKLQSACDYGYKLNKPIYDHNISEAEVDKKTLRIGFVSPDFREHPIGYFFENFMTVLRAQSDESLSLYVYATSNKSDDLTNRIKSVSHKWTLAVNLTDLELANEIFDDQVDVLIDLSGHTANNRLAMFALKPAPIQASWQGYFATTGLDTMDYFLGDPWLAPPCEDELFVEKIWRLPETNACFSAPTPDVQISPLPARSLGYVTFGCFNHLAKLDPAVLSLWVKILKSVPHSRLFLKNGQLGDASVCLNLRNQFTAEGVPLDRLYFEGFSPRTEYLEAYNQIDISLDPFPYPGGTTSIESLWMGTPVLTMKGNNYLSRVGESIAQNAGLSDWIAVDEADYLTKAIEFSSNLETLQAISLGLRDSVLKSPLFDAPRLAGHFEDAMWGMWKNYVARREGS